MAICNVFKELSKSNGTFFTFSQYSEDLTINQSNSSYKVIPSRVMCCDVDYTNWNNTLLPELLQNNFENGCSFLRSKLTEKWWTPEISKNLFWNEIGQKLIKDSIVYYGDINIQSYSEKDNVGYNEIYCYIPNDAKQSNIQVQQTNSESKSMIYDKNYICGYSATDKDFNGLLDIEHVFSNNLEFINLKDYNYVYNERFKFKIHEQKPDVESNLFTFNTIIVFYDILEGDELKYTNIPLGMYVTGIIENGTMTNPVTKYVSNDDIYGAGTSYGLRICSRFTVTPNGVFVKNDSDTLTNEDAIYAAMSQAMSAMVDSQIKMDDVLENANQFQNDIKDHLSIFKNSRTNVPYIRIVDGEPYWFVNGKNTGQKALYFSSFDSKNNAINVITKMGEDKYDVSIEHNEFLKKEEVAGKNDENIIINEGETITVTIPELEINDSGHIHNVKNNELTISIPVSNYRIVEDVASLSNIPNDILEAGTLAYVESEDALYVCKEQDGQDWSTEPFVDHGAETQYARMYKIKKASGVNVINLQHKNGRIGIYITLPRPVSSYSGADCFAEGAGMWIFIDSLNNKETKLSITSEDGLTYDNYIYYVNGEDNVEKNYVWSVLELGVNEEVVNELSNKISAVESNIDNINNELTTAESDIDNIETQISTLKTNVSDLSDKIGYSRIDGLNYKLDNTRTLLRKQFGQFDNGNIDGEYLELGGDILTHYSFKDGGFDGTDDPDSFYTTWDINPSGESVGTEYLDEPSDDIVDGCYFLLTKNIPYYISIKCEKYGQQAWWCVSDYCKCIEYPGDDHFYFNWGIILWDADEDARYIIETRNNSYAYGDNILAGKIKALYDGDNLQESVLYPDNTSYFDLSKNEFVLQRPDAFDFLAFEGGTLTMNGKLYGVNDGGSTSIDKKLQDTKKTTDHISYGGKAYQSLTLFPKEINDANGNQTSTTNNSAKAPYSLVTGYKCSTTERVEASTGGGGNSFVGGESCNSSHANSLVYGKGLQSVNDNCSVLGRYNNPDFTWDASLWVGGGSSDNNRQNMFIIQPKDGGQIHYRGELKKADGWIGDFAEYFEWEDGNPNNEDRVGYMVELSTSGKIRFATSIDNCVGVTSETCTITSGSCSFEWHGMYLRDDFGRIIYEDVDGEMIPKKNPNYNPDASYISRDKRPEWCKVGLLGQILTRQDGTLEPGGFAVCVDGVATKSLDRQGYRVVKVINGNVALLLVK